jgi:hypothetical protein
MPAPEFWGGVLPKSIEQSLPASASPPTPNSYSLSQLRYDLRKLKAHGLIERDGKRYAYRLTDKGTRAALLFVLFHQRVCGPMANSFFRHRPAQTKPTAPNPNSKLPTAKPTARST